MFRSRSVTALYLLVALMMLPACMLKRRYVVMQELHPGAEAALEEGAEILGDVEGYANFSQFLTLFSTGTNRGTKGTLLAPPMRGVLEGRDDIPLLDPLLRRVWGFVTGTTRIEGSRRAALGRAMQQAEEMGADTIVAPRFEIETRSFTFFVPLGFLHSTGRVWVRAKAVRLGSNNSNTEPGNEAGSSAGTGSVAVEGAAR